MRSWQSWPIYKNGNLYVRGRLPEPGAVTLAVVGSRRMSEYGQRVIPLLLSPLAVSGVVIVSGFMYGVDVAAHKAALEARGVTVAVLGAGLDRPCPAGQDSLYTAILSGGGAVVSQFAPDEKAQRWMFPKRNAVVAQLSRGVLVIEAARKSGSLITAGHAQKMNTPVMAVPGPIVSPLSEGTNGLIRSGAFPVTSAQDIASLLNVTLTPDKASAGTHPHLIDTLKSRPLTIDELSRALGIPLNELSSLLTIMTLSGEVIEREGKYYAC